MGFVVTLSYDRAMYIYQEDHMTTPKRVPKASAARFSALAWDKANNWLLTGAADGCVKVWSQEGRILDELMHTSDQVCSIQECFGSQACAQTVNSVLNVSRSNKLHTLNGLLSPRTQCFCALLSDSVISEIVMVMTCLVSTFQVHLQLGFTLTQ